MERLGNQKGGRQQKDEKPLKRWMNGIKLILKLKKTGFIEMKNRLMLKKIIGESVYKHMIRLNNGPLKSYKTNLAISRTVYACRHSISKS